MYHLINESFRYYISNNSKKCIFGISCKIYLNVAQYQCYQATNINAKFAVMGYKDQKVIFQLAIPNLYKIFNLGKKVLDKKFYFTYIKLSFLQKLERVLFFQIIMLKNIENKLD